MMKQTLLTIVLLLFLATLVGSFVPYNQAYRYSATLGAKKKRSKRKKSKASTPKKPIDPPPSNSVMEEEIIETEEELDEKETRSLPRTLGGGTALIFAMARKMLVWDAAERKAKKKITPRWHPYPGFSDVNPKFRTKPPLMNNQGYAATIWRNARKSNKPSLWRYSLRTYYRMKTEKLSRVASAKLKIKPSLIHHEGALVACSKLGLWKEAIDIYREVAKEVKDQNASVSAPDNRPQLEITENIILSVVKACVRGSKKQHRETTAVSERRAPLDAALAILDTVEEAHGFPIVARQLTPLAAAYQSLGFVAESKALIQKYLVERTIGPEPEYGQDVLNINNVQTKDKAAYSLIVKGAVAEGDWSEAIDALRNMTDSGLYPTSRHLNAWTEVSERKTKNRATKSWKKKRDQYWLDSVGVGL